MFETLLISLFGWPAIIASLLLSIAGITWKRFALVIAGAILALPFSLYLSGSPAFRFFGLLLPLFQTGSALAVRRGVIGLAWFFLLPFVGIAGWLAWVVLTQP